VSSAVDEIFIFGAGKVGRALARAARAAAVTVTLRARRKGWPSRPIDADLLILAVRDGELASQAAALAERGLIGHRRRHVAVVHCAGALAAEILSPLRAKRVAIGKLHPLLSFADRRQPPPLSGGYASISGDPAAVRLARRLARRLGLRPCSEQLDAARYHAAAALVANGASALAALGAMLLEQAGASPAATGAMLGPLLRSVGHNLEQLGPLEALTGPVRRGDSATVAKHLSILARAIPGAVFLHKALLSVQLGMARGLEEASEESLSAISMLLSER